MNKEEIKLSDKELQKCLDELQGTNFLNAFCVLDWILKTRKENEKLQENYKAILKQRDDISKNATETIEKLLEENRRLKNIETSLIFIKNRAKQGMTQENINKCAIEFVNSYLKEGNNE